MSGISDWHKDQINQANSDLQRLSPSEFGGSEYWNLQNKLNSHNTSIQLEANRTRYLEEALNSPINLTSSTSANIDYSLAAAYAKPKPVRPPVDMKAFLRNAGVVLGSLAILSLACGVFAIAISLTPTAPEKAMPFVETYIRKGTGADEISKIRANAIDTFKSKYGSLFNNPSSLDSIFLLCSKNSDPSKCVSPQYDRVAALVTQSVNPASFWQDFCTLAFTAPSNGILSKLGLQTLANNSIFKPAVQPQWNIKKTTSEGTLLHGTHHCVVGNAASVKAAVESAQMWHAIAGLFSAVTVGWLLFFLSGKLRQGRHGGDLKSSMHTQK
jgi:hypothetical protein